MHAARAHPHDQSSPAALRRLTMVVVATAQLLVALDATIVNVALPSAQRALGIDDVHRAWVVTSYTLSFAGLLLVGGQVVDRFGARRALQVAMTGFAVAAALAGASHGLGELLAGRAMQGACAAVMTPAALSMITRTYTEPRARGRAFGVYGAVASSGAVVGLLLGGLLTQALGWRWCLYVNVVVCVAAVLLGRAVLPQTPPEPRTRLDITSAALATTGLGATVLGFSLAARHGWGSPAVVATLVSGAALGVGFTLRQRLVTSPLLPLDILRNSSRVAAHVAAAAGVVGMFGIFLVLTYHYQTVLGYSPVSTGLAFLPMTVAVAVSSYCLAGRLMGRMRPLTLVVPGLLVTAAALALLTSLDPTGNYASTIMPAEVLAGVGMGCVVTPSISAATAHIDPRHAGVAAASVNVAMQMGASVGTALLNTIAIDATARSKAGGASALVTGYSTATAWSTVVLLAAAVIVTLLATVRKPARREEK